MRAFRIFVLAAVVLLSAGLLLPRAAGGASEYVRTYGNSMEPAFQAGDLAMLRPAASYEVGDVAAYRSAELDQIVLHRIVERDGTTLVFQGDNNDFRDRERLTSHDVIGRLALRVPKGGSALSWLEHPLRAAAVAITLSALPAIWTHRRHRRRQHDPKPIRGNPMKSFNFAQVHRATPWLATAASALLLVGGLALTRPETALTDGAATAASVGTFTYSAPSSSPLYPDGFTTGDPVFRRLADQVAVAFEQRVAGGAAEGSTVRLDLNLSGAGGWKQTVALTGTRPLDHPLTSVRATLDLAELERLGQEAAAITATAAGAIQVEVTAVLDTAPGDPVVAGTPMPKLGFSLDESALRPTTPAASSPLVGTDDATPGSISQSALLPITFLGRQMEVRQARLLGLGGGVPLMGLAAALAWVGFRRRDHPASVVSRYGSQVLAVVKVSEGRGQRMIDVSSMADLARVAKHHDQIVLRETSDAGDLYLVALPAATYRYGPHPLGKPAAAAHSSAAGSEPGAPVRA